MPTKIPLRATYDTSGNVATGLSEYQSNEFISTTFGGTGANTYAQGEILVGNASGSLTKNTIQGAAGQITVTTGDGTITIGLDSSIGYSTATKNVLGTVKIPERLAVTEFCSSITGGTNYTNSTAVLTRGGATGSSGLLVNTTTVSGEVTAVSVANSGTRYAVNDQITITRPLTNLTSSTPTPATAWKNSSSYTNVSSCVSTGDGNGATFDITTDGSGNPTISIFCNGLSYIKTDQIVITEPTGSILNQTSAISCDWQPNLSHTALTQCQTSGSGIGASYNVTTDNSGQPTFSLNNIGQGYKIGDTLTILDAGTTDSTATLTITCAHDSYISNVFQINQTHTEIAQTSSSGSGTNATFDITTDSGGLPTFAVNCGGSSYAVGDTITVTEPTGILTVFSTLPTPSGAWEPNQSYTSVSQTSTTGSGTGATVNITTDAAGNPSFTLVTAGAGYAQTDQLVFTDSGNTSNTATLVVTSTITQQTAVLSVKTVSGNEVASITNTTPIKRSTASVTSSDTDAIIVVKTINEGGLAIDQFGNVSIAPLVGMSDGSTFSHTSATFELLSRLEIDVGGRVTNIDKQTLNVKDGVTIVDNDDGSKTLQSDGLAVAMSIVFGG